MVKHNKIIPNAHFHKKWFDQPGKKKARRLKRAAKAAAIVPRPLARLRPVVRCPTEKHCAKVRLGRGFSLAELKAAKITPQIANSIGVAVDHRRTNKSTNAFSSNVQRLQGYKAKLVMFPKKGTKVKTGDTKDASARDVTQSLEKTLMPADGSPDGPFDFIEVSSEMKNHSSYQQLCETRNAKKLAGIRKKMKVEKDAEKKN